MSNTQKNKRHLFTSHTMAGPSTANIRMTLSDVNDLSTEKDAIMYLRDAGFYAKEDRACNTCSGEMRETSKKNGNQEYLLLRCQKNGCKSTTRVRGLCPFFGAPSCQLRISQILELITLFVHTSMHTREVSNLTGRGRNIVALWYSQYRKICSLTVQKFDKLCSTPDDPIQIDISNFCGARKYNKGRLLGRNKKKPGERNAREQLVRELALELKQDADLFGSDIDLSTVETSRNESRTRASYGNAVVGPWVVGMYYNKFNVRYFVVPDRSADTLTALILRHVETGSTIHTDQWAGYCRLGRVGFIHHTVNHSENYVDPISGVHTQGIERAWVEEKMWMRRFRRPRTSLQMNFDESTWRRHRTQPSRTNDLVFELLNDLRALVSDGHARDIF